MTERTPPHNIEAERSVLGSAFLSTGDSIDDCPDLEPEHFYNTAHGELWNIIRTMYQDGIPVDAVTVAERLQAIGKYEEMGGTDSLMGFLRVVPHSAHASYYAGIVRDRWVRRQVILTASQVLRDAYNNDPTVKADDLLADVQDTLSTLESGLAKPRGIKLSDGLLDFFDDLDQARMPAVPTGFFDLDEMCPIRGGQLIVVGARPSAGKSSLAVNLAAGIARNGKGVAFFSLEQSRVELIARLVGSEADVEMQRIDSTIINPVERSRITDVANDLSPWRIFIDDKPRQSVAKIASALRVIDRKYGGVDAVVVDYLQLVEPEDKRVPREQQVAAMSRAFKFVARDMLIPVIVLAQLNRQVESREDKRPRMSDFRESGAVEQDADSVWFIHRPEMYDAADRPGEAELIVAKHRNGKTGIVNLTWKAETMTFLNGAAKFYWDGATRVPVTKGDF